MVSKPPLSSDRATPRKMIDVHFDTDVHGAGQDRALAENGKIPRGHAGDETDNL